MKRNATKHTKKAIALTNPNPSFVSLVRAGANMTPFLAVKSAEGNAQEAPMKVKKSDTHDIAGLTFRSASFADEAAVQAWLTAGGYEDTAITKKDDGDFFVAGVEGLSDVKQVEADGVVIMTGKREVAPVVTEKTEAELAAEAEAASGIVKVKSDEAETLLGSSVLPANVEIGEKKSVQLGDIVALAHKTSGLTLADWNALPEADREAKLAETVETLKAEEAALVAAAAAAVVTEKTEAEAGATVALTDAEVMEKAIKQIEALASTGVQFSTKKGIYTVTDIGYVLNELRYMMEGDYNGLSDNAKSLIKGAAQNMITVLVEAMQTNIDAYVETFKADAAAKAEADAQEATAKADATETPDPLAALMLRMEQMEVKVTELTTENTTLKSDKTVAEERVKSLEEDQRQTRKSADAAEAAAATTQPETSSEKTTSDSDFVAERRKKSMLGIS